MFMKPFATKSKTIIKGSENKKLRNRLLDQYRDIDEIILDTILPSKSEIVLAKLLLHNGNLSNVYFYQGQPIVFTYNDIFFFTVYSLWKCRSFLPWLTTWPAVFEKLSNGADLMLPGVIPNESSLTFKASQPCAVCLKGNSSPVSVGSLVISSTDFYEHKVEKGKAVLILHSYKDLLWALGDKSNPPQTSFDFFLVESKDEHLLVEPFHEAPNSCLQFNNTQTESTSDIKVDAQQNEINCFVSDNFISQTEKDSKMQPVSDENILKFDSMDDLIDQILLYALKKQKNKLILPILTSTFYRNFLIGNCPKGTFLDIKQTSYKKLSKYLLTKQGEGFLKVEELSKGVDSITSINFEHEKILEFRIKNWEINKADEQLQEAKSNVEYFRPEISEVFLVSAKVQEFFKTFGKRKGDSLSAPEIRQIITDYVKSNSLQDGSKIKLDAALMDIVVGKNEIIEAVDWPQLMQRFLNQMSVAYYMSVHQQTPILHKGAVPRIILDVEQRASNKKVTTIQNLKHFGIDEEKFAQTLQRLVSGSASLTIDKSNIRRVVVQGNQIHHIKTLLIETYQIPVKYIVGLDKAIKIKR